MRIRDARGAIRVAAVVALSFVASNRSAQSSGITANIDYGTTGTIESGGITGAPVVSFQGVSGGTMSTDGPTFDLGRFVVAPLPTGTSTTYNGTPFDITFMANGVNGVPMGNSTPVDLRGTFFGTITGGTTSTLLVYMDDLARPAVYPPINNFPTFQIGNLLSSINDTPHGGVGFSIAASGGSMTLQAALVDVEVVPEPSTVAIFGCITGLVFLRRLRGRQIAE